jgi:hypothetical protein
MQKHTNINRLKFLGVIVLECRQAGNIAQVLLCIFIGMNTAAMHIKTSERSHPVPQNRSKGELEERHDNTTVALGCQAV